MIIPNQIKYAVIYAAGVYFAIADAYSQAAFSVPDTVCIRDSMQVVNLSPPAQTWFWNFCSASLNYMPLGENMDAAGQVNGPAFISVVHPDQGYYAFITNHEDGTLTRNYFAGTLNDPPLSVNLGSVSGIDHLEGIQVVENMGNWYGFMVGGIGSSSSIIRLDFGTSPGNVPATTNLGNMGELSYPIDLYMYLEETTWIGLTVNYTTSTVTRFVFTGGLENPPVAENLGNIGNLNKPCGIQPVFDNGNWYVFITNFGSNTLSRLDFSGSLLNTPSGTNLGGSGDLYSPFDLTIIRDCEQVYGFVANHYANELVRLEFTNGIAGMPVFESLGNVGDLYQPHGISNVFRENDRLYMLTGNINNTITRLYFQPCSNASLPYSTERNPPRVTYDSPGIYNVSLSIDEGLPTQQTVCKDVVVFDNPVITLGNDTSLVPGASLILSPGYSFSNYTWSTGATDEEITINEPGTYLVEVTDTNGCKASAQIIIEISLDIPKFITPNGDGINDRWEIPYFRINPGARISIYDRNGKKITSYRGEEAGWDGTYLGKPVNADSYWYVITFENNSKPLTGYVSVVR
jgi:gliding motility-associated-like protein